VSQPAEPVFDAAERAAEAVASGNLAGLMALITPEALAQVMTMGQETGGLSLAQMPQITDYTLHPAGETEDASLYDVTFNSTAGSVALRATWKNVLGQWKIAAIEVLSAQVAEGDQSPGSEPA
jgi:hypothetical protein